MRSRCWPVISTKIPFSIKYLFNELAVGVEMPCRWLVVLQQFEDFPVIHFR